MTSICVSGGASRAKDLTNPVILIGTAVIGALIVKYNWKWAQYLGTLLGAFSIDTSTFCTIDPPADPGFTAADAIAMYNITDYPGQLAANAKLRQLLLRFAWFEFCECTSGTQPTVPTPPTAPTGLPIDSPTVVTPPPVDACKSIHPTPVVMTPGSSLTRQAMEFVGFQANVLEYTITNTSSAPAAPAVTWLIDTYNPNEGVSTLREFEFNLSRNQTRSGTIALLPNEFGVVPVVVAGSGTGNTTTEYDFKLWCGADQPGSVVTPCCPPDPLLTGMVQQILTLVTLTQRQAAPFSYVYGSNHTGLSDDGEFDVFSLLGIAIDVTTLPGSYGSSSGNPEHLYGLGYVNLGTADGWTQSRAVDHDGSLWVPPSAGAFTRVGYSLAPGVVIAIRELVREP